MLLDIKPENGGLVLAVTMRFPEHHHGERKRLSINRQGQLLVEARQQPTERYRPLGFDQFARTGQGKIGFEGRSTEGGRTADLKVSFEVHGDRLTMRQSAMPLNGAERGQNVTLERVK